MVTSNYSFWITFLTFNVSYKNKPNTGVNSIK